MNPIDILAWAALVPMTASLVMFWTGHHAAAFGHGTLGAFAAATVATAEGHTAWAILFACLTVFGAAGLLAELGKGGAR